MNNFIDFLTVTNSQKEISLILAKDEAECEHFVTRLEDTGFRQAIDTTELFKHSTTPSKAFVVVKHSISKDLYDFLVQYSTGQIAIYDKNTLKFVAIDPIYKGVSIVFVMTHEALRKTQKSGFSILENVGLTYQS